MRELMNRLEKPAYYLSLLFVFLIFLNFRDIPNRYAILGAVFFCLFYMIKQKKIRLDLNCVLLAVSIAVYDKMLHYGTLNCLMDVLIVSAFMVFGKYSASESKNQREAMLPGCIFLLSYSLYGLLNSINYFLYPFETGGRRTWPEFWTGQDLLATQQCIYVIPLLAMIIPAVIFWKKHKVTCSLILGVDLFFMYHSMRTLSRTPIMAIAVLGVWAMLLLLIFNRKNKKLMNYTKWTVLIGTGMVLLFLLVGWNWIREIPFVQNMGKDGGVLNNIRFRAQRSVLMQIFDYPMGNPEMYTEGLKLVHNVWLDMAKKTGIIPFLIFTAYTIVSCVQVIKLLRSDAKPELKYLLSGLYFAFILYYTVEPALDANIRYIVPWTFINGVVTGCNDNLSNKGVMCDGSI